MSAPVVVDVDLAMPSPSLKRPPAARLIRPTHDYFLWGCVTEVGWWSVPVRSVVGNYNPTTGKYKISASVTTNHDAVINFSGGDI